jgi:hypothetical protein
MRPLEDARNELGDELLTLRTQSSGSVAAMKLRSAHTCAPETSGTTAASVGSPELMACAVVTIWLWPCWR